MSAAGDGVVAVLGAGVMGEALLSGLLRAGRPVDRLVISERRPERVAELSEKYGVQVLENGAAAAAAQTVLLVVKPQDMASLLAEIHDRLAPGTLLSHWPPGSPRRSWNSDCPKARRWCG